MTHVQIQSQFQLRDIAILPQFLIYFRIFATAVASIILGFISIETSPLIAIASIGIGIFFFFVRSFLANFKTYAPAVYLCTEGISLIISIVSSCMDLSEISEMMDSISHRSSQYEIIEATYSSLETSIIVTVIVSVIMLICECVYFQKRDAWFNQK